MKAICAQSNWSAAVFAEELGSVEAPIHINAFDQTFLWDRLRHIETELNHSSLFSLVISWWKKIRRKGFVRFKKKNPQYNQTPWTLISRQMADMKKKYFSSFWKKEWRKEGVLRQIAEPDARMRKNTKTHKRICQTSLSTVIWQSHTSCSLSEAHNSALVLTNYTFQCIRTRPETKWMAANLLYTGNIQLLPLQKLASSCFAITQIFNNKLHFKISELKPGCWLLERAA